MQVVQTLKVNYHNTKVHTQQGPNDELVRENDRKAHTFDQVTLLLHDRVAYELSKLQISRRPAHASAFASKFSSLSLYDI